MAAERRFRAMGSDAHLIVVGGSPGLPDNAVRRIEELESRWSRFRETSEISALNRAAGSFVGVSPDTVLLIRRAVEAWRFSGGAFDPTVLGDLVRAGYDRSFELLGPAPPPGRSLLGIGAEHIEFEAGRARLPAGIGFDPGGIGKGLAADLVCEELLAAGAAGACVNLGGDLRVAGVGPDGAGWTVDVEHPGTGAAIARLGIGDGAVATSTTLRRHWQRDGEPLHHLIDPQTGRPSDTDLTLAAVVAGQAWMAEVLAKAVILAGSTQPFAIIGGTGAEAITVDREGRVSATEGIGAYLRGEGWIGANSSGSPSRV